MSFDPPSLRTPKPSRRHFIQTAALAALGAPLFLRLKAESPNSTGIHLDIPDSRELQFGKTGISIERNGVTVLRLAGIRIQRGGEWLRPIAGRIEPTEPHHLELEWEGGRAEMTLTSAGSIAGAEVHRLAVTVLPTANRTALSWFELRFSYLPEESASWADCPDSFHWLPNVKHEEKDVAGDHVFRSPAAVLTAPRQPGIALVPDLEVLAHERAAPQFLDMSVLSGEAPWIGWGFGALKPVPHFYYQPTGEDFAIAEAGLRQAVYFLVGEKQSFPRAVNAFLWQKFASTLKTDRRPQVLPLATYAAYGYEPALDQLWRAGSEPDTGGITNVTFRKPDGTWSGRLYADDLWFHSWFNGARTAWGLARWGQLSGRTEWCDRARDTMRLVVRAPRPQGIFPAVYAPHDGGWKGSGKESGGPDAYHLPDAAWTGIWLRKYHVEIEPLPGAVDCLRDLARFFIGVQDTDGGFPTFIDRKTLAPAPELRGAACGAMPLWFLGEELLAEKSGSERNSQSMKAILGGTRHLRESILPRLRFEDFELYFSCSKKPLTYFDPWTASNGINTLAIQWCAEAFRVAHLLGIDSEANLSAGRFCVDLLCLFQQVWNPPYLSLYTFGGFGVMNTDGEWNDARQAQFAETLANWYTLTGDVEYKERAIAAARSAFALMVCEENRAICPKNFEGTPRQFEVHGMMAENYGHHGTDERSYQSSFHWGTGSALTTAARLRSWLDV